MTKSNLVVITGASSGIGKSLAEIYAKMGFSLLLIARREHLLQELQHDLQKSYSIKVHYLSLDLLRSDATAHFENFIEKNNLQFNYFFNNAGLGFYQKFATHTQEQLQQMIQLNISALTLMAHFCVNYWKKNSISGYLVNIASIAAYAPIENYVVYAATKAFVKSFSLSLRSECEDAKIHVICVCPGGTHTEFFQTSGQVMTSKGEKMMMSSNECAKIIYQGVSNNKPIIVPGYSNKTSVFFSKVLPEYFFVKLSSKVFNYFIKNS
jgi:short-subunit dehydrogenase